jgi:hypothetical protein
MFAATRAFDDSHISVLIENASPGGIVVIGSTVKVSLTDPEYSPINDPPNEIASASVNFSMFGGPAAYVAMDWNPVTSKWEKDYIVQPGVINTTVAKVTVKGTFFSGGESTIPDDELFTVNNNAAIIGALDINTTITNPGNNNIAIVGSTIVVTFTSAVISSASVDFSNFGGPVNVPMVEMPVGTFTASYTVVPGNNVGSYQVRIIAYEAANPNPGIALDNDQTSVDNKIPDMTDFVLPAPYLRVNANAALTFMKIDDVLHVFATLNPRINKVWIDWSATFIGGTLTAYDVVGGVLHAQYTPAANALPFTANLTVKVVKLESIAGNVSVPGFEKLISGNLAGDDISADLDYPTLTAGDLDLYYDNNPATGWLRFSPNSPVVADYPVTTPDNINLKLRFANWGVPGDFAGFQLKFEAERSSFTRDYNIGSPFITAVGPDVTVSWDGKDGSGNYVASGTYGVTLWKVWDLVGNTLDLSTHYIINGEYPPHSPLLNADLEPQVTLNRMHVVVDNIPLTFVNPVTPAGPLTFTYNYHTDKFVGDVTFPDQVTQGWAGNSFDSSFNFQAQRSFLVDTNQLRWESGKYWIVQSDNLGNMWYWNKNTSTWNSYAAFDPATMKYDLVFPTQTALNASPVGFTWNANNFGPALTTVPGDYTTTYSVRVYLQDNSGNIVSSPVVTLNKTLHVTEQTYTANLAVIDDVLITSQHDGGTYTLAPFDGAGDHNFYLNGGTYYTSLDQIDIKVTLNNKAYLKAGQAVKLDLTNLGLGVIWKTAADFDAANQMTYTISNAVLQTIPAAKLGAWILGTNGGAHNLPFTAISSVIQPNLTYADYAVVSTHMDKFNLVIPTQPVYPLPGTVTVEDPFFSPGNAAWTYNAEINPANDGIQDSTRITISVPSSTYPLGWNLEVKNPVTNAVWTRSGSLAANVSLPSTTHTFYGLSNSLAAMADPLGVQALNVKLNVQVTQFADDGYTDAMDPVPATSTVTIDNQSPSVVAGSGYTYDAATKAVTFVAPVATPVVSSLNNVFEVTLKTSEALRTNNLNQIGNHSLQAPGWSAVVVDNNGQQIMNNATPLTALVNSVTDLGSNVYKIQVQVLGMDNTMEYPNATMVLRLPWDEAGNPGRINNPSYPIISDLFCLDSSEVNFKFHVLNARPWISKIQWTNYQSVGSVEYNEAGVASNLVQAYVNNYTNSTGTLEAWISGGITRDIVTTFKADVSAISTMANAAALPATAVADGGLWKLTWNVTNMKTTLANNTPVAGHELKVFATTLEGATEYHSTNRSIFVKVDKSLVSVSSSSFDGTNNFVTAGAATPFTYNISDAMAGIWWDAASITLTFTNGVTSSPLVYNTVLGTVTGTITLAADTAIKNFVATFTVKDKVNNVTTLVRNINVQPAPMPSNVVLTATFPAAPLYFRPGTDITVDFAITNPLRADKIEVKLFNNTTNTQVGATQTITAPTLANYTRTFTAVTIPHTNVLRADVIVTYSKYNDAAAALNTAATNSATSAINLIADGTNPNGLPVITVFDEPLYDETQLNTLAGQWMSFTVTDAGSGVDRPTATLTFNPATGITVGALDLSVAGQVRWFVTADVNLVAPRVQATVTCADLVANVNTLNRYLNVMPIPVLTNALVIDNNPVNPDPTNWFVPGHDLKVSFNVANPERVNSLTVTLTAPGVTFSPATQTFTGAQIMNAMNVIFTAVNPANLDGKVLTATISGNTLTYSNAALGTPTPTTALVSISDVINVDTKPVILQSVEFFLNAASNDPINYLLPTMTNLKAVVKVKSPNNITVPAITLPAGEGTVVATLVGGPVITGAGVDRVLTYTYSVDVTNLAYSATDLYAVSHFKVNTATIYGYNAVTYDQDMVVIGDPTIDQYGIVPPDRSFADVGRAPNGWFAPEHNLITEYKFVSTLAPTAVGVMADFDRIEDNVPDDWDAPNTLTINTVNNQPIVIPLSNGRTATIYPYLAKWNIQPDYASVWNAYHDGQSIQVDYRYLTFLPSYYLDDSMVKVDKEVPTYDETGYEIAVAMNNDAPVYEYITSPVGASFKTINLALTPPAPGLWESNKHIYLKVAAKDDDGDAMNPDNGVGAGWIQDPIANGWTVTAFNTSRVGNFFYKEWKLSPIDPASIHESSVLHIELQGVEDLVGHKNYVGANNVPIHSNQYVAVAPTITLGFEAGMNSGMADYIIAYQKFAGDVMNTKTSPYIKPGQNLGFIINLDTDGIREETRGVAVVSVEPTLVEINDPTATDDSNTNWHALQKIDPLNPYNWYLAQDIAINPAAGVNAMGWKYRVTYQINYTVGAPTTNYYTSSWLTMDVDHAPLLKIDRTSPQFVVDGVLVRSASSVTDNYVVPGELVDITVRFSDESGYNNPNTKPTVAIANLNTFIDMVGPNYPVSQDDISFDAANNVWIAHVIGLQATAHPNITSENIVVTLQDPVLNVATSADKFVEIANNGPIVPLIRGAKYLTKLDNGTWVERVVAPVAGQIVDSKIEVYIDTQYSEFIDEVTINVLDGANVVIDPAYTIREALPGELGRWVAVFDGVSASNMVNGVVNFTANTKRIPYNAPIFEHSMDFSATVDVMDFVAATPVVMGESVELPSVWINDIINPNRDMKITVDVTDMAEDFAAALPADLSTLFTLESIPAGLLTSIPTPVVTGTHTATWTVSAADIADLGIEQASVKITYKNVYGLTKQVEKSFYIDLNAPIIAANGIQFVGGDNFSYPQVEISTSADWTDLKVYLSDPQIMGHDGSGLHIGTLQLLPQALTYQETPEMVALNNYVANTWGTDANGTYLELSLADIYAGFTAYDLAIGHYDIIVNTTDRLGNNVQYVQAMYFNPATTSITLSPVSIDNEVNTSEQSLVLHALVNDPTGTVNGVHFRLYYDIDADGVFTPGTDPEYASDIIAGINGNPDMVPPFQTEWNLTDHVRYNWAQGTPYVANTVRNFFVRVSAITQSRYITDQITLVHVTDDIAPVPEVPGYVVNPLLNVDPLTGTIIYDYANVANNSLTLNTNFVNWPDAYKAIFEISKVGSNDAPVVIESAILANPTDPVSVVWNYGSIDPNFDPTGTYTVVVKGVDYVGNVLSDADAVSLPVNIEIENPANLVTYTMNIRDIVAYNNHMPINAEYGNLLDAAGNWDNPFTNLRLNASFNSLQGIDKLRFRMTKTNLVDGTEVTTNITNDQAWQADYVFDADGYITANQIVANNAYVFLNETDYQTNNTEDFRYTFWVELVSTHAVSNPLFVGTTSLRIDNRAPQVAITEFTSPVSWAMPGQFKVEDADAPGYDIADIVNQNNIHLEWYNAVDDAWYPAVFGTVVTPIVTADYYTFKAWNIAGGSLNTFLGENFAGAVQMRVIANDAWGNTFTSPVAMPVVDNQAPTTRFTHVIHSVNYPALTPINDIAGLPDELSIVSSTQGTNGASNLQLFVDASTLGNDRVMPLMMFHQKPNGMWQPVEYDHESWNLGDINNPSLYEFVIPSTMLDAGQHRFTVVRKDAMGNLEGDIASLMVAYDAMLTDNEKLLATDLIVNVTSIDDVIATIQYPADLAFIGGRKAITATTTDDNAVDKITFQHKVGATWQTIATVTKAAVHPVTFELLRSDVPQYNDLPWVPGIHLFNGATELGEMVWGGTSWTSTIDLTVGTAYSFQYGVDLNNNGMWEAGEPLINDPKGFTNFTPTPWTLAFNSYDYAQGLHEFRAIPLDTASAELEHYQAPSSWMIIDNVKPVINGITSVGNITNVTPGTVVPFVTDVTALLVATDDIVNVRYEFSGQMVGTMNRKWTVFGNSTTMSGNYLQNWTAANPLIDNIDNNGNGLVDEAAEANGTFYVRAIASDRAGNFQISNEFAMNVDGSAAEMALFQIEDVNLANTNYIYQIDPSLATITLSASEIATGFDPAVTATFSYKFIADIDNVWPAWTQIGTTVNVVNGVASTEFGFIQEGYYQFMVTAYDALGNAKSTVTTVIFNDVTGPEITFTAVGTRPVISEKYAFAQLTNDFNGSLTATLSDVTGVSAVTFEYSVSGLDGTWVNITTTNNIPGSGIVSVNWNYPPLRAPLLYLKAIAQDANANNMQTEIVKLYHDTTAPSVDEDMLTLTHSVVAGMKVIDIASDIEAMLTYTNLVDGTINDVNSVIVRLVNNTDATFRQISSPVYGDVNMAANSYIFTPVDLAGLMNGTYRLEIELTDFAGNTSGVILPVAFQTLYNDTMAPANLAISSITYPNNVAVYNAEDISFRVAFTDLIGLADMDAVTATFTSMGVSDVVTAYAVDHVNNWIDFTWNPSPAMEQFIINGAMNMPIGIEVAVTDLLGQTATLTTANNYFTLTYGIPNIARVMAVTDVVEGNRSIHYVNWNMTPAQVVEMVGTNHTSAMPDPLKVYAYVPHMSEVPQSITMSYRLHGSLANPTPLGTAIQSNLFDPDYFIDPNFFVQFQQQYVLDWDISALATGTYEVITTSNYPSGSSSSAMLVNVYNGTIVPTVAVDGIVNGNVERGDTYALNAASFTGASEYLSSMVYQYRYVTVNNNVVSPTSQWMYFGDANGNPVNTWIADPYNFDWTVYPYYLHNNTVQIVGFAKDKWGTETPISSIISSGAYTIAHITDTTAPAVAAINVSWNGMLNPAWQSGIIAPQATVMANVTTNINPNDLDKVEFYYNNALIATETGYQTNNLMNNVNTQAYPFTISADAAVVSGELKVMAYDVYGNVSTTLKTINIDNTLPTANLTVTFNGTPITTLERENTVVLNANAADAPAGVQSVAYAYAYAEANPIWIAIAPVEADGTANWLIPADLEYGHDYIVKATVTDLVGHVTTSELTFEVSDTNTVISIVSVVGHTPVNDIIPMRLHGNLPVVTSVPANQNIPRLAWYVRTTGENSVWNLLDPAFVTALYDYTTVLNLDDMASGDYYLGVGPADRTAGMPVDQVMITLDNTININGITSVPATNGSFNGNNFVVNFTIASDDEIVGGLQNQVMLSYAYPLDPTNWMPLGNANILNTLDGVHYTATFQNINITHNNMPDDGYYLFRLSVQDLAIPTPNVMDITVASNVLYDVTLPNVAMTSINGVTDMMLPVNIDLGTAAIIEAAAYDVLGGQTHQVASGIQKLEFYYNYNGNDVMIGEDTTAPYSVTWNTLGFALGMYNITVNAIDNAGNVSTVVKTVNIVSPGTWQPFAMVTAMNFDGDAANQDAIYAVVDTWANEQINGVSLEYYNGTTWTEFAQATNMGAYWKANFNAELMSSVTKIRTVVNYNNNLISITKPELAVTYSTLNGGSLVVTNPTIMPGVYYNNEVRITGAVSAPRVTTMFEDTYVGMPQVQSVNGNQTAFINVPAHGQYNFWAAAIDYNTWMMQLNKAVLNTQNIGTVASNGISTTVPANSFVYFETVMPTVALEDGFTALSLQNAVLASPQQNLTYTVTLNATPAAQGTIVGMYYDGAAWISVPATVNTNNTVTFNAPSGYIYTVAQYTGVTINTMFVSVDPQYVTPANAVWTLNNTAVKFLVYTGMNQGGYETPLFGQFTYQMYLDNMLVIDNAVANYADGIVTYNAAGLAAGTHTVRLMVTMDGFNAFAEKVFNVETTEPVIVATGTQLTVTNRTITATITDPQTGIADVYIDVTGWGANMTIPMENMTVNGNVYSYTFTMDDLNALGYDVNYTEEMAAVWHASNNLMLGAVTQPINYTVNVEGPAIAFTGFTGGWWLNPTFNTPLTFTVTVPVGRTMPADGVMVDLEEVTANGNNQIQQMTLAPVSVAGNVYSYSLNFGQMLSPLATAVKLSVAAMDNYNVYNISEQTYGLDMAAPVVWAMAPIGAPIDNDGDGLFNEDAPNGVNEDLDWVDLNQNGFWDAGEPQIVDEDPIDFLPAVIPQGTNVVVAVGFQDYSGLQYLIPGTTDWYYTGQSGINAANVAVTLNGAAITGTITNGTFTHNAGVLSAGHYTVVASVPDVVGNVGSLAFEFDVVGGAPTITINALGDGGYWLNSVNNNILTFTVDTDSQLANGGVVANVYTVPANALLQGPMTLNAVAGVYSVNILGGLIPANQTGIRLEVIATDVWGGTSTANQVFGIDNNAPVITLTSPAENAQFVINATVNIMASITDQTTEKAAGTRSAQFSSTKDRAGSGIETVILTVIAPDGTNAFEPIIYPENTQVIMKSMPATQYGTYIININAKDGAGNQCVVTRNFMVTPATAPTVTFSELAWLNSVGMNNLGFTVNSPVAVTVSAKVYTYPSETMLMGPLNVNPVGGVYTVALNGGMIPADQTSVRLQVVVTDQFNNVIEANNYYSVDKIAPAITILTPANGTEITLVDDATKVRIDAQFTDVVAKLKSSSGSGIAMSKLVVIDPLGNQVGAAIETGAGITETTHEVSDLMLGTYTVRVTVWDNAGNQAMASVNFTVVAIPAPPVNLEISDAHIYPNPMAADLGARFSVSLSAAATVNVRIYDFAGREVRSMDYAGRTDGKSTIEIVFDGCNNNGEKLARGSYFARVIANDGKKIVEKIVKIAIKK